MLLIIIGLLSLIVFLLLLPAIIWSPPWSQMGYYQQSDTDPIRIFHVQENRIAVYQQHGDGFTNIANADRWRFRGKHDQQPIADTLREQFSGLEDAQFEKVINPVFILELELNY